MTECKTPELEAKWLRDFVAEQDVPCPGCGYNLRALEQTRCPECNQHLVLRVNLSETSMGLLIAALVPPIGAASCAAVMLAGVSLVIYDEGWPPWRFVPVLLIAPAAWLVGGTTAAWMLGRARGRQWFRRLDRGQRVGAVAMMWMAAAALLAAYLLWAWGTL